MKIKGKLLECLEAKLIFENRIHIMIFPSSLFILSLIALNTF